MNVTKEDEAPGRAFDPPSAAGPVLEGSEKRRYIRYELLDYAVLERDDPTDDDADPLAVVVTDIGLGGLQIRARATLPPATPCLLRVATDGAGETPREHRLPCEVRHAAALPKTDLWAIGLRFTPRTHEERIEVAEFVHLVFRRQADAIG